ncbi:hypothetical protein [Candidatus Spongiihabitans sp.]|uniref:hypothetical protein n=1 Tax=Candidatus Spongiihabitans sp. TaxID=3101308 RepID=UPI003C7CFC07
MKQEQLQKRLGVLINSFGYKTVRKTLGEMRVEKSAAANRGAKIRRVGTDELTITPTKKRIKPNAANVVKSFDITDREKKAILFIIAEKYEAKEFMPNVNHVRDFLGGARDVSRIKSRQQVTSAVFKQLAGLETSELHEMLDRGFYGPSKRLESYAKAIEGFARQDRSA